MHIRVSHFALMAAFDGPKLVTEADGSTVKLRNGKIVFTLDDGKEDEVDPAEVYTGRSRLAAVNSESATHRRDKEALAAKLKAFEDAGITDAKKAADALSLIEKIDQKKLIDAGEVDKVRDSIKATFEGQTAAEKERADKAEARVRGMLLQSAFDKSQWIKDNIAIPVDIFQATFSRYFEIDNDGNITAKDASGNPILTRNPDKLGHPAPFEEAVKTIVDGYAQKDAILLGNKNTGSGNDGKGGNAPRGRTVRRADWQRMNPVEQQKVALDPNMTIVD